MSNKKSDLQKGAEALKKKADAKKAGYDATHPNASDFNAGWDAGRKASDPKDETPPKELRKQIKKEYGERRKGSPERAGYKAGYASGSHRGGS